MILTLTRIFRWVENRLDKGGWMRRAYLVVAISTTWKFVLWAMSFAASSPRPGSDVAMIIGAIGVPLSAMTGHAFTSYLASRK